MLLHTVLFWLRNDLTPAQVQTFVTGVQSLTKISTVRFAFVGTPSATRRPVIDHTYTYKLVVSFDDLAGHDVYQDDPIHLKFLDECKSMWTKVQIYDGDQLAG